MARTRYFQTSTDQDPNKKDPRDLSKNEPLHYQTWDYPLDMHGYSTIDLLTDSPYVEYKWQAGDRLDQLANRFYNDDQYWWVIALVTAITYPLGIRPGTVIFIPNDVNDILSKLELI